MRRRSPGVVGLKKSFDGFVVDTSLRFHDAVPASNQPALSPTRGSGFGFVTPTIVFGAGAELGEDDVEDDAHADAAIVATASERNDESLMRGPREGTGNWESGTETPVILSEAKDLAFHLRARSFASLRMTKASLRMTWLAHRFQHQGHAIDFSDLIDVNVGRELEDVFILHRADRREQRLDHRDRAVVVLDHVLQE